MYRHRRFMVVSNQHSFDEALSIVREMNDVATRRNLPSGTVWMTAVGVAHQLVVEIDYETLADFEAAHDSLSRDADWPKLIATLNPILVEGRSYSELLRLVEPPG